MRYIATSLLALLFVVAGSAYAAEDASKESGEHMSFDGTLVCLGCDLKQAEGARAACKTYGHAHALKTKDGRYIGFLQNQYSDDLIKGEKYHNKSMKVHGVYFADANVLDVEGFEADGKQMGWCGHCNAMDHCPYKGKSGM